MLSFNFFKLINVYGHLGNLDTFHKNFHNTWELKIIQVNSCSKGTVTVNYQKYLRDYKYKKKNI